MYDVMIIFPKYSIQRLGYFDRIFNEEYVYDIEDLEEFELYINKVNGKTNKFSSALESYKEKHITYRYGNKYKKVEMKTKSGKVSFRNVEIVGVSFWEQQADKYIDLSYDLLKEKLSAEDFMLYTSQFNEYGKNISPFVDIYEKEDDMTIDYVIEKLTPKLKNRNEIICTINGQNVSIEDIVEKTIEFHIEEINKYKQYQKEYFDRLNSNRDLISSIEEDYEKISNKIKKVLDIY